MEKIPLKNLEKLNPRDCWTDEAQDFTPWLAKPEHLALLSEAININISLIKVEAEVGDFKVDILAEDEDSGEKIIIENQLEKTDHIHLGQIITYAAGLDAKYIIWIVSEVRDAHQRAIEWLNNLNKDTFFFLIKIELFKIGDSNTAPYFDVIVKPNDWVNTIKLGTGDSDLTPVKLQQLAFWTKFKEFVNNRDPNAKYGHSPRAQHWYDVSIGSAEAHVSLTVDSQKKLLGCEIYFPNKNLFHFVQEQQEVIEKELGETVESKDRLVGSGIFIKKKVNNIFDMNEAQNHFAWLYEKTELFKKTFGPRVRDFFNHESNHN